MNNIKSLEQEIEILENIYHNHSKVKQRDLARIVGLSLGMTNAIIKRLIKKGWLKARKINERNIHYVVSPLGIEEIAKRSYRYFKRTIKNVVYYKEAIDKVFISIAGEGYKGVILIGESDLDFIVEHLCQQHNLSFQRNISRSSSNDGSKGFYVLYSENKEPLLSVSGEADKANYAYLREILVNL
ncbi:MAG TPA: winged helix-turn-helix transcriptional regulator [Spirochaetales bacterium]|nr:winged helix-turn-helix transcriptional regulator [Spirochaetales bacterium]